MQADRVRMHASEVGRRLLFADDPDPRVLQGVFIALVGLDFLLRSVDGTPIPLASWPGVGFVLTVALTVATVVVPWHRLPRVAVGIIPVLDILALGLLRLDDRGSAAAAAIVVPGLWLARQFGKRGAVTVCVAGLVLMGLPSVLYLGASGVNLSRSLMVPLVAGWVALAVAQRPREDQRRVRRRRRAAGRAGAGDAHHRRAAPLRRGDPRHRRRGPGAAGPLRRLPQPSTVGTSTSCGSPTPTDMAAWPGSSATCTTPTASTALTRQEMPTYRAAQGEEFDDCRIWVGDDPLSRRALSVSARSVRGKDGTFAGAALAYKDVTDFMRALRVKDEFVASVSHELRTPLTSIMGYVDLLLEDTDLDAEQASHLHVVSRNSDRLRRLVADLLHSAQIDEGPMNVVRTEADLGAIVHQSLQTAAPVASGRGSLPGLGRTGLAARGRRLAADLAGRRQPAVERGQVHPRGRPGAGDAARRRRPGRAGRQRHRHRHLRSRPRAAVHAVLPGRACRGAAPSRASAWA